MQKLKVVKGVITEAGSMFRHLIGIPLTDPLLHKFTKHKKATKEFESSVKKKM